MISWSHVHGFVRLGSTSRFRITLMQRQLQTIVEPLVHILEVKKSKFIAKVHPISTAEEALSLVQASRKEDPKASHHCWAFRIGQGEPESRSSDDGEPGGTAGRPILAAIEGEDLVLIHYIHYIHHIHHIYHIYHIHIQ